VIALTVGSGASALSPGNHQLVTGLGLSNASFLASSGVTIKFSRQTIGEIGQWDAEVDACLAPVVTDWAAYRFSLFADTCAGLFPGTSRQHFDDNQIKEGTEWIQTLLANEIMDRLIALPKTDLSVWTQFHWNRIAEARAEFGVLLHTIQDFYAHSNWVERFTVSDIPWAASGVSGLPDAVPKSYEAISRQQGTTACALGAVTNPTRAQIVTEYFWGTAQSAGQESGQCVHGPASAITCAAVPTLAQGSTLLPNKDWVACFVPGFPNHIGPYFEGLDASGVNGINKDSAARPHFVDAKKSAIEATTTVANQVMAAIASYDIRVLCLFVGQPASCDKAISVYRIASGSTQVPLASPDAVSTPVSVHIASAGGSTRTVPIATGLRDWSVPYAQDPDSLLAPTLAKNFVCRKAGGEWIAKSYAYDMPVIWHGPSMTGPPDTMRLYGGYTLSKDGTLTIQQGYSHTRDEFDPLNRHYFENVLHTQQHLVNLNTGAGDLAFQTQGTICFVCSIVTDAGEALVGRHSWPANSELPSNIPEVHLSLVRTVDSGAGVPAECNDSVHPATGGTVLKYTSNAFVNNGTLPSPTMITVTVAFATPIPASFSGEPAIANITFSVPQFADVVLEPWQMSNARILMSNGAVVEWRLDSGLVQSTQSCGFQFSPFDTGTGRVEYLFGVDRYTDPQNPQFTITDDAAQDRCYGMSSAGHLYEQAYTLSGQSTAAGSWALVTP
jgi:hypothetical protein